MVKGLEEFRAQERCKRRGFDIECSRVATARQSPCGAGAVGKRFPSSACSKIPADAKAAPVGVERARGWRADALSHPEDAEGSSYSDMPIRLGKPTNKCTRVVALSIAMHGSKRRWRIVMC